MKLELDAYEGRELLELATLCGSLCDPILLGEVVDLAYAVE